MLNNIILTMNDFIILKKKFISILRNAKFIS